ncbi:hypothetical protein ACFL6I_21735 [candidate division KSB1 bacterium]
MKISFLFRILLITVLFITLIGLGYLIANPSIVKQVALNNEQFARISGGMGILLSLAVGYAFKKIYDLRKLEKQKTK